MSGVSINTTDLQALISKLAASSDEVRDQVRPVVSKGALNIKNDWRRAWSGMRSAPYLANAVTYDITGLGLYASAEIGPDKSLPQGALGNLLEFGSINNAPQPGGCPALAAEEPRFVQAVETLAVKALDL